MMKGFLFAIGFVMSVSAFADCQQSEPEDCISLRYEDGIEPPLTFNFNPNDHSNSADRLQLSQDAENAIRLCEERQFRSTQLCYQSVADSGAIAQLGASNVNTDQSSTDVTSDLGDYSQQVGDMSGAVASQCDALRTQCEATCNRARSHLIRLKSAVRLEWARLAREVNAFNDNYQGPPPGAEAAMDPDGRRLIGDSLYFVQIGTGEMKYWGENVQTDPYRYQITARYTNELNHWERVYSSLESRQRNLEIANMDQASSVDEVEYCEDLKNPVASMLQNQLDSYGVNSAASVTEESLRGPASE
ncbi:MAG: hypothetical protein AAF202_12355 [Pseudomonadota bacterium]